MYIVLILYYNIQKKFRNKLFNLSTQISHMKYQCKANFYDIILGSRAHFLKANFYYFPCFNPHFSLNLYFSPTHVVYLIFHLFCHYFHLFFLCHKLDFLYALLLLMLAQFQIQKAFFGDFGGIYIAKYILKAKF